MLEPMAKAERGEGQNWQRRGKKQEDIDEEREKERGGGGMKKEEREGKRKSQTTIRFERLKELHWLCWLNYARESVLFFDGRECRLEGEWEQKKEKKKQKKEKGRLLEWLTSLAGPKPVLSAPSTVTPNWMSMSPSNIHPTNF